ncbi:MAG: 2-isopropylmalate synthase [Chloroflexi bacterium]|nr:2-isopropylmalate synthase [Chloroflexota bacterium]
MEESVIGKTEDWWVSPFNFEESVKERFALPEKVLIHDATLRDGEQTPGIVLRSDEKVAIASALGELGVDRIEAGMPAVSEDDARAIKEIARLGLDAQVLAFCRATRGDVEKAAECGAWGVVVEVPIGLPKLRYQFKWNWEDVLRVSIGAVARARELGLYVVYFPYDTTRARLSDLRNVLSRLMQDAPPDSIGVIDTTGCILPEGMAYLVRQVRGITGLPVEVHTHNDLGLAVATELAAVGAGAEVVHVCCNGLGERAGNAALEEVAVCLRALYGIETRIKLEKLQHVASLVEALTGVRFPANKPVIGRGNFTRESGIGIEMLSQFPLAMFSLNPRSVGQEAKVVFGKKSGAQSVRLKLAELGKDATDGQVRLMLERVKARGIDKKSTLSDGEVEEIITVVLAEG